MSLAPLRMLRKEPGPLFSDRHLVVFKFWQRW